MGACTAQRHAVCSLAEAAVFCQVRSSHTAWCRWMHINDSISSCAYGMCGVCVRPVVDGRPPQQGQVKPSLYTSALASVFRISTFRKLASCALLEPSRVKHSNTYNTDKLVSTCCVQGNACYGYVSACAV